MKHVQRNMSENLEISIVSISLSFSLVPEAEQLYETFRKKTFLPPSSLFHDMQDGDDKYAAFRGGYTIKTNYPLIRAYTEKRLPIFCVLGDPVSLRNNPEIGLEECFDVVKRNLKILPQHFIARLLLSDPEGIAEKWKTGGIDGLIEPARLLRTTLPATHLDKAYFEDDGLADIISIGMDFFQYSKAVTRKGNIQKRAILEYYANKCIPKKEMK